MVDGWCLSWLMEMAGAGADVGPMRERDGLSTVHVRTQAEASARACYMLG